MNKKIYHKGFTLIEILVVISIIGILSTIIYASFGDARQDAQNKTMRSELKEVQLALELYKAQNGEYPPTANQLIGAPCTFSNGGIDSAESTGCSNNAIIGDTNTGKILIPEFIADLPAHSDSSNPDCNIVYQVDATNHSWYKLTAQNCFAGAATQAEGIQVNDTMARCPSSCGTSGVCNPVTPDFYETFAVYSIGGQCK